MKIINPDLNTQEINHVLKNSGYPVTEWGKAVDGTPILSACCGGDKTPAIFITAGAHSTETAGIHAALNLLGDIESDHEVHVLPLRDPFGFSGVQNTLSFAMGEAVLLKDHQEVFAFLRKQAELLWQENNMFIFKLGQVGFVWNEIKPGLESFWEMMVRIGKLAVEEREICKPLWGRSLMLVNPCVEVEGAGEMKRCFHTLFSHSGEWLHLNRMFGRADAPSDIKAVDHLMKIVQPGLTCDLHEGNGNGFWLPLPKPKKNPDRVFKMAKAFFDYVHEKEYPVTDFEDWLATDNTPLTKIDPYWMPPDPNLTGLFWVDTLARGEGHNLSTYADLIGVAFGTESPMIKSLEMRVDAITNGTRAAIKVWEESQ